MRKPLTMTKMMKLVMVSQNERRIYLDIYFWSPDRSLGLHSTKNKGKLRLESFRTSNKIHIIRTFNLKQSFLEKMPLPRKLSDLDAMLLSRFISNDTGNHELASTALKLLAVSRTHLGILELAWAVTLGTTQRVTTIDALGRLVDHQRVMALIHPFVAHVDFSDMKKHKVRLAHESVKEFIIKELTSHQPYRQDPALTGIDQVTFNQAIEGLEALALDICIRYLFLDDIGDRNLFSEVQMAIAELPQGFDLFNDNEGSVEYNPNCTWESWEEDMVH